MKYIFFAFILFTTQFCFAQRIVLDKSEAKEAFHLLNDIRNNPERYKKQLGLSNLNKIKRTTLVWNKKLAEVAAYRAKDMAKRGYFDHVTPEGYGPNYFIQQAGYDLNPQWTANKGANNFESIAANRESATAAVRALIIGKESPGFMHRKHLLGMDDWNGSLYDVGIAFVRCEGRKPYDSYFVIIIAKHDW